MSVRNRSQGWQHAKLTGHRNEDLAAQLVRSDSAVQKRLLRCAHLEGVYVEDVEYGGLCETDVDCVLGGRTKSKTDLWLYLSNGKRLNVSIKKEDKGQVFLIGIERFIQGYELQYQEEIPPEVCRALSLYFGCAEDTLELVRSFGHLPDLELRKHRLTAATLNAYDPRLCTALLRWVNGHISQLFDFCFARGLASKREDWAQIVWYVNLVGESALDQMFYLPDLREIIPPTAFYGAKNCGSTIQLPFGFVQWHSPRKVIPGSMQFHHSYAKLSQL